MKRTCAIGVMISLCCVWCQVAAGQWTVSLPHEKGGLEKKLGANGERGIVELVESIPIETSLDLPGLRNTPEVWLQMIDSATSTIDIEAFYFSAGPGENRFELILKALENASRRGVRVRMLSDAGFHETYPEVFERFGQLPNTETRIIDAGGLWGGVVHAKFFIVDGEELFVGSQNWDWRALEHIHELGVRIRHKGLAHALETVFLMDWERSVGEQAPGDSPGKRENVSVKSGIRGPFLLETESGDGTKVILAASPNQALPEGIGWDEPLLQQAIDGARARIRLHLLTFMPVDRAGRYYETLECALK